jgi:hypothetical protein
MRYLAALLSLPPAFGVLDPFGNHSSDFEIALKSAIAVLAGAIVFLFFYIDRQFRKRDKTRERLQKRVAALYAAAKMLANCPNSSCPYFTVKWNEDSDDGEDTDVLGE